MEWNDLNIKYLSNNYTDSEKQIVKSSLENLFWRSPSKSKMTVRFSKNFEGYEAKALHLATNCVFSVYEKAPSLNILLNRLEERVERKFVKWRAGRFKYAQISGTQITRSRQESEPRSLSEKTKFFVPDSISSFRRTPGAPHV